MQKEREPVAKNIEQQPKQQEVKQGPDFQKTIEKKPEQEDKIKDLTETLQRLQAEYENYKKRVEKEKVQIIEFANAGFAQEFLPLLDSFDSAIGHLKKGENVTKENALQGIELLHKQLMAILENQGLEKIEALNKKFDHSRHEVMMTESRPDEPEEKVLEEFQKGYMFKGIVIRPSKVKINKIQNVEEKIIK